MAIVKLELDDGDAGTKLRAHLASIRKIRDETKKMPAHIAAIGSAWKVATAGVNDHLTKVAAMTRASRSELASYQKSLDRVVEELKATRKASDQWGKGLRDNRRDTKSAADKLNLLAQRQEAANRVMQKGGVSARAGGAAARLYSRDLDKLGGEGLELARKLDRAQRETLELSRAQRAAAGVAVKHGTAIGALAGKIVGLVAAYVGIQTVFRLVRALALGSIDAFADLQDAVVSLRKVTDDLGDKGLARLVDRLEELSTGPIPIATENLIELAAVAGTLGIQTEAGLANAAATGAKLAVATDLSAEVAIKGLARILAINNEAIDQIDDSGSALVELGNTSRATEAEILPIANEIARSTANFQIGTTATLGFSAALAEMGAKAEGSGSALAELFGALLMARETGEGLEDLASIAGVTAGELKAMTQGNIAEAAVQFLQGLGRFGDRGALALEKVGLSSKRTAKALLPMAANADRLADRLRVSAKATEENTALNEEAAAAFSTLRFDTQRVVNQFRLLLADGIEPLSGPMSDLLADTADLIGAWRDFGDGLKKIPEITILVAAGLDLLADKLTRPIERLTVLAKILPVLASIQLDKIAGVLEAASQIVPLGGGAPIAAMAQELRVLQQDLVGMTVATVVATDANDELVGSQSEVPRVFDDSADAVGGMTDQLIRSKSEMREFAELQERIARAQDALAFGTGGFVPGREAGGIFTAGRFEEPLSGTGDTAIDDIIAAAEGMRQVDVASGLVVDRMENLSGAAEILHEIFGGLGGVVGELANALPGFLRSLQQIGQGGIAGILGGAALGGGIARLLGGKGQGGVSSFGAKTEGDFSDVGGSLLGAAGAAIGTIFGGAFGAKLGSLLGGVIGSTLGKLMKTGADEGLAQLRFVGGQIETRITKDEGGLGQHVQSIGDAVGTFFDQLGDVLGTEISIGATEIAGGRGLEGEGVAAALKIRGEAVIGFVNGLRREFTGDTALADATEFIALELLKAATFGDDLSDNVRAALASGAESMEELKEALSFALRLDDVLADLGPVASAMKEITSLRIAETKEARQLGIAGSQVLRVQDKRLAALREEVVANLRSVAGITDYAAALDQVTRSSSEFNAGLDEERQRRLDQIDVLKAQNAAFAEAHDAAQSGVDATEAWSTAVGDFSDLTGEGFERFLGAGRGFNNTLADSARGMAETQRQIDDLEASFSSIPDAIDPDLIAQGIAEIAQSASDNLFGLLAQFEGFAIDNAAAEASRNALARGRIAIEIQGLRNMLASAVVFSDLSRATLQAAIAAGETLLAGDFKLRRPGGGGRRQEAKREAEAAAEAQATAAESFAEAMLGFRQELSATSAERQAFIDRVDEFRELAAEAGAPLGELNQGLRMMAEIDIRAIGDAWATTAAQFRASDLEGAVRDIGQRRTAAIEEVNIREDLSPEAAREAKKNIRETTVREFAEIGQAALSALGGPLKKLNDLRKENVKTIRFLSNNLDKLGITAGQLARTVRGQVLGPFLALAKSEAERVGDTDAVARIEARQQKIAVAFQIAQLSIWEQMLRAAGAFSQTLESLFDDTRRRLSLPTVTDPTTGPGGLPGGRTGTRSPGGDLAAIRRDIEGILEGFRQSRLGPTATSAASLAQQLKDVRDQARLANFDLGKVEEAFAVARAQFVKTALDAIGPAEGLNASVVALDEVENRFKDAVAGMLILETGAEAIADAGERLVLASDEIENNLKAGIRQQIDELQRLTAPSNKVVFDEAQARFEELAATAQDESLTNAQRVEALEDLAGAAQAFRTETIERFGAGPGTQPILDAILATLEQVEAADILVTTDREILEAQAASLAQIELTTAAQPTASSSSSSFSSLETSIASLGGGIIDPGLLTTLMENLNGNQEAVEATISELVDVLGADIFADVVESFGALPFATLVNSLDALGLDVGSTISGLVDFLGPDIFANVVEALGSLPFADLVNSLDAAGLDFGGFVDQIRGIDLSAELDFDEIISALGPFGPIVQQLGAENFAEIVSALQPIISGTSGTERALKDENGAMVSKLGAMKDALRPGGGVQVKLGKGLDFTGRNTGPGSVQGELRTMSSIIGGLQTFHAGGIAQSTGLALLQRDERVLSPADTVRFDAGQFIAPVAPAGGDSGDLVAEVRSLKSQVAELTRITKSFGDTRAEIANMEAGQADAALEVAQRSASANEATAEHTETEGAQGR